MKTLLFEYGHSSIGSWDGKWSGDKEIFAKTRVLKKEDLKVLKDSGLSLIKGSSKEYFYNFGDGWTSKVTVTVGDSKSFSPIVKLSKGFMGYDWMIDSIIKNGEIKYE